MDKTIYREKLISIFQEDVFNEIIDFWKIVEESKFDYKIFVSKKCYVLYKVFMPILNFQAYRKCIKMTDTAIPVYIDKMKNSSVLVVDDVFIHGRAIAKVDQELSGKTKKVRYYTFAKNSNNEQPQATSIEKMREKSDNERNIDNALTYLQLLNKALLDMQKTSVKGYIDCNEYQWKRISDLIMKSLWGVNMPYASYLPIFICKDKNRISATEFKDLIAYRTHSQEEQKQSFEYYIQSKEKNMINSSIIHYCFVFSKNDFTEDCKMIPMVFFDCENTSIDKKFIFESIHIIYGDKANKLIKYFTKNRRSNQNMISLLKYLIFSVGYLTTTRFFTNNRIKNDEYYVDLSNAVYSFGEEIKLYLNLLQKVDYNYAINKIENSVIKSISNDTCNKNIYSDEHDSLFEGLRQSYTDMRSCSIEKDFPSSIDVLARYFKFNNIYNEQNFYNFKKGKKKYVTGLRFSEIKDFLQSKGFSNKEIILGLMHQYNLGAATIDFLYDYDKKDNIKGINMYWRAGEQSYKCISQTYVLIVYFQNTYARMFCKGIADFLYNMLLDVANNNYTLWNMPFSKKDIEKYCNIGDNVYNAFDIERYCKRKEFKYLGYVANQMQQYVLRGHFHEVQNKDQSMFKFNLFNFMKSHTDKDMLDYCKKILWGERNIDTFSNE